MAVVRPVGNDVTVGVVCVVDVSKLKENPKHGVLRTVLACTYFV